MKRTALNDLLIWKNSPYRKPLIINGARQVGKTWLLRDFGNNYFDSCVYLSLDVDEDAVDLFRSTRNPQEIIKGIELLSGKAIKPKDTLLIFDEIQNCPEALMSLKYFCEEASDYYLCAAGTLLGLSTNYGSGYPVGKVDTINLYPFSFAEFLDATGDDLLCDYLKDPHNLTSENFAERAIQRLRDYMFVGGMPGVIERFARDMNYHEARKLQLQILEDYKRDFAKHADVKILPRLFEIWDSIPVHLSQENKKFIFGRIREGARSKDYELALIWLEQAGLITKVKRVKKPYKPLSGNLDFKSFKVFLNDIGLLCAMSGLGFDSLAKKDEMFTEFKGSLTEQFVCQQLICSKNLTPFYWSAENSQGEIDFLVENSSGITAIEVKSSQNVRSRSLSAFHDKFGATNALRFSLSPYRDQGWMENVELYKIINESVLISDF